jgi:hypothetical protein
MRCQLLFYNLLCLRELGTPIRLHTDYSPQWDACHPLRDDLGSTKMTAQRRSYQQMLRSNCAMQSAFLGIALQRAESCAQGIQGGLNTVGQVQLVQDVADVGAHRHLGHGQTVGDSLVAEAFGHQG